MPSARDRALSSQYEAIGKAVYRYYRRRALAMIALEIKWGDMPSLFDVEALCQCGRRALIHEHRDYLKPLEVVPSCHSCNTKLGAAALDPEAVVEAIRRSPLEYPRGTRLAEWRQRLLDST